MPDPQETRGAAPAEAGDSSTPAGRDAARAAIEAAIAGICADVLDLASVRPDDNFLLLGGESLLATQVSARIRARFNCEVSIRSILVGTVAEVASEVFAASAAAR